MTTLTIPFYSMDKRRTIDCIHQMLPSATCQPTVYPMARMSTSIYSPSSGYEDEPWMIGRSVSLMLV